MERSQVIVVVFRTIFTCPLHRKRCDEPSMRPLSQSTKTGFSGVASGVRPEPVPPGTAPVGCPGRAGADFPATGFCPDVGAAVWPTATDAPSSAPTQHARWTARHAPREAPAPTALG